MRVAIMQPYFFPYAGYFRLMAGVDLFCILDTVQFPRRGWVHRNRFTTDTGEAGWLTLPLLKASRDTNIEDLAFPADAPARLAAALSPFPALREAGGDPLMDALLAPEGRPVDYLSRTLTLCAGRLGIATPVVRASTLQIDPTLRAQDRILAIAQALGATGYLNAPGGVDLYDGGAFAEAGIALRFLAPWEGSYGSILERLLREPAALVAEEIGAQLPLEV